MLLIFATVAITTASCSNVYLAESLKKGMSYSEVVDIMGQPTDVEEHGGYREDWIYIGGMFDDYRNVRVVFYDGKFLRWRPAGYNYEGMAAMSRALDSNVNTTNQVMRSVNESNTNLQLNLINQNLNSINSTLNRRY